MNSYHDRTAATGRDLMPGDPRFPSRHLGSVSGRQTGSAPCRRVRHKRARYGCPSLEVHPPPWTSSACVVRFALHRLKRKTMQTPVDVSISHLTQPAVGGTGGTIGCAPMRSHHRPNDHWEPAARRRRVSGERIAERRSHVPPGGPDPETFSRTRSHIVASPRGPVAVCMKDVIGDHCRVTMFFLCSYP